MFSFLACLAFDMDFPGFDLAVTTTETAGECYKLCEATSGCVGWSWAAPDSPNTGIRKNCWVKDNFDGTSLTSVVGTHSGPYPCPTTGIHQTFTLFGTGYDLAF